MSTPTSIEPGHPDHPTASAPTTPPAHNEASSARTVAAATDHLSIATATSNNEDVSPGADTSRLAHSKSHATIDLLSPIAETDADEKANRTVTAAVSPLSVLSPGAPMSSSPSQRREGEVEGNHVSKSSTPGHSRLESHSRPDRIDATRHTQSTAVAVPPDSPLTSKARAAVEESPDAKWVRYAVKLGSGSFKDVWLGIDTETGKEVAWNVIDLRKVNLKEQTRIRMETELLKKLRHPHIIEIYDVWEINQPREDRHELDFVTQKASYTLKQHIANLHPAKTKVLKKYSRQILTALVYLHSLKPPIIHRDLKCDNIFIDGATGDIRIGDFGLSISNYTATSIIGTPGFMAPELFAESYNELVDIWAFGMCVLEMATNQYPYFEYNGSVAALLKKGYEGAKPEGLSQVADPSVREFILLCLQPVATRPSARQLLDQKIFDLSEPIKTQTDNNTQHQTSVQSTPLSQALSPAIVAAVPSQPPSPIPLSVPQQSSESDQNCAPNVIGVSSSATTASTNAATVTQTSLPHGSAAATQYSATAPIATTSISPPQSTSPTTGPSQPVIIPAPLPTALASLLRQKSDVTHDAIIRQHADEIIPRVEVSKTDDPSVVCITLHCRIKRSLVTQVIDEEDNEDEHEIRVQNEPELAPIDESDIALDERKVGLDRASSNESNSSRGDAEIDTFSPSATPSPPSPQDLTSIVISRYDFSRDNYLAVATALVRRVDGLQHFDWAGVEECVALKIEEGVREYYNKWTAKARTTINSEIMTLLTQLGITLNYAAKFIEQEVSIEDLMFLSEEDLVTFLPKLGPRRRLQQYIEAQKRLREEEEAETVAAAADDSNAAQSTAPASSAADTDDGKKKKKKASVIAAEPLKAVKVEKLSASTDKKDKATSSAANKTVVDVKKAAPVILVATPAIPTSQVSLAGSSTVAVDEKKTKEKKLKASVAEELNAAKAREVAATKQIKAEKVKSDDPSAPPSALPSSSISTGALSKPKSASAKLSIKPATPNSSTQLDRRRSDDDSPSLTSASTSSPSFERTVSPVKRPLAPITQTSAVTQTHSQPSTPSASPLPTEVEGMLKRTASTPAVQHLIASNATIPPPQTAQATSTAVAAAAAAAAVAASKFGNHRSHSVSSTIVETSLAKLKGEKFGREKDGLRPSAQTPPSPAIDRRFLDNNDTSGMNALLGKIALDLDPKKANKLSSAIPSANATAPPHVPPSVVVPRDRATETSPATSPTFARRNSASTVPSTNGGAAAAATARWQTNGAHAQVNSAQSTNNLDIQSHSQPRRRSMDETGHVTTNNALPTQPLPPFYSATTPNSPLVDQNIPIVKPAQSSSPAVSTPSLSTPSRIPAAPVSAYQSGTINGGGHANVYPHNPAQSTVDASIASPLYSQTYPPVAHIDSSSYSSPQPHTSQRGRASVVHTHLPQTSSHYVEPAHHSTPTTSLPSSQTQQAPMSRMSAQR